MQDHGHDSGKVAAKSSWSCQSHHNTCTTWGLSGTARGPVRSCRTCSRMWAALARTARNCQQLSQALPGGAWLPNMSQECPLQGGMLFLAVLLGRWNSASPVLIVPCACPEAGGCGKTTHKPFSRLLTSGRVPGGRVTSSPYLFPHPRSRPLLPQTGVAL
jgi:hypothetical protein